MLRVLFILFSISFITVAAAQIKMDTVYLYMNKETVKDCADEYRVRSWGKVLKAEDYSITYGYILSSSYYSSFDPYVKDGHTINYLKGVIDSEGEYVNDKAEGLWKSYYNTGALWYTEEFKNDHRDGFVKGYFKTGELKREEQYKKGQFKKGKCYTRAGKDTTFYQMHQMPVFAGGSEQAMVKYFQKNLVYPQQAKDQKIQGKVYVQFTIMEDGSIQNVGVVRNRGAAPILNDAAVEFVKQMPKWKPGCIDGVPIKVKRIIPISFQL